MKKNVKLIITSVLLITLLLTMGIMVNAQKSQDTDDYFNRIRSVKNTQKLSKNKDNVVLEIGDRKITKEDFELAGATIQSSNKDEIEAFITKRTLMKEIAEEKKIHVDKKEIQEYMNFVKEEFNSDEQSKDMMKKYFEAYGFDENTFWTDENTYKMYYDYLLLSKFRAGITKEIKAQKRNISQKEMNDLVNQQIDNLIKNKKNKVKIIKHY